MTCQCTCGKHILVDIKQPQQPINAAVVAYTPVVDFQDNGAATRNWATVIEPWKMTTYVWCPEP
jgi:hypothetical protein